MASSHGDDDPSCSRKRARNQQRDVELIDLEDMELEHSPHGLSLSDAEPCLPAWAKKRTNFWVKDATELLRLEPNSVRAHEKSDTAGGSHADAHMQGDEFCVNIPLNRMLHSYAGFRETCVICYHKSRVLQDAEMEQWMRSDDASCVGVEQVWLLGQGFFAIKFGSKLVAEQVLLNREMPFNRGRVCVVPYIPCFFPSEDANAKQIWPVWVAFPCLPLFLKPFLPKIASGLGKVLHISQPSCAISSASPRVCILWDAQKKVPDYVKLSFDELGTMKLAVEFDTIGIPTAASQACENGKEKGGVAESLPLPPVDSGNGEERSAKKGSLPLLLPAPASNEKVGQLSSQKVECVSAPPRVVKRPEPAIACPLEEIKAPIITSSASASLGKGLLKCPTATPIQVTHSLPSGAHWASGQRAAMTYDNALYQHKKSKSSGKELAVVTLQHRAMKEVSSNAQVKQHAMEDGKQNALEHVRKITGKETDLKLNKENIISKKECKEGRSVNKGDHGSASDHIEKSRCSFQSESLTSSPKPHCLSALPYTTPPPF